MKDLSITQEFLLCSVNEKGKLPVFGKEVPACILASSLIELMVSGSIQMDEKSTVRVIGGLCVGQGYLKSLLDWLNQSKPMKMETIAREYCLSLTEKQLNALVTDIGSSLVGEGCVTLEKGGAFAGRPRFIPERAAVDHVIQKIRAELLESGTISDETVALVSLLEKSHQVKKYFSDYEGKQLKARLKEIKEAPSNHLVKQMVEHVEKMVAIIAVIASAH